MIRDSPKRQSSSEKKRNIMWNMEQDGIPFQFSKIYASQNFTAKNEPIITHPGVIIERETKAIIDQNILPQKQDQQFFQPLRRQINEAKIPSPIKIMQIQQNQSKNALKLTRQQEIKERAFLKNKISQLEQILIMKESQLQNLIAKYQMENSALASMLREKQISIGFLGEEIDRLNQIIRIKAQEYHQEYQRSEKLITMNRNKDNEIEKLTQKINKLCQQMNNMDRKKLLQNDRVFESHQIPQMIESQISHQQHRRSSNNEQLKMLIGVNRVESIEQSDRSYTQRLIANMAELEDRNIDLKIEVSRLKDILDEYLQSNPQVKKQSIQRPSQSFRQGCDQDEIYMG